MATWGETETARSPFGGTCSIRKGTRAFKHPATDCGRKFDSSKGWSFVTDPAVCPLCEIKKVSTP